MPKCTVTVNQNHELVYPDSQSFARENSLLRVDDLSGVLPEIAVEGLKLKCMHNGTQYQVTLSVSITDVGDDELIPQIQLTAEKIEEGGN